MKIYVGITDRSWFDQLSATTPDEVNFWRPGGKTPFKALEFGGPFLFKLHSPENYIVGGGFFVKYARLPVSIAWLAFEEKNGVRTPKEFLRRVRHYRRERTSPDPSVGCIVLTQPFFFEQNEWIPTPEDWHPNIVQGRMYHTNEQTGAELWAAVRERLDHAAERTGANGIAPEGGRYGLGHVTRQRIGQGAFRVLVTEAYDRRCAITGEKTLPVLEAAHIRPFGQEGPHTISNGLLLRADLHILFDRGYATVDDEYRFRVSGRIREEYANGHNYYALDKKPLVSLPDAPDERPSLEYLDWHHNEVFVG